MAEGGVEVELVRLRPDSDPALLAAVLALRPARAQHRWCLPARQLLPPAVSDPRRVAFAVLDRARDAVGYGALDLDGGLDLLLGRPARGLLLRAFAVDAAAQGRGVGTAAARGAVAMAARLDPAAALLGLCVHQSNTAARTAYARAGFADSGRAWARGGDDPQLVLVADLHPGPRAPRPRRRAHRSTSEADGEAARTARG